MLFLIVCHLLDIVHRSPQLPPYIEGPHQFAGQEPRIAIWHLPQWAHPAADGIQRTLINGHHLTG
ncbi:MAG: hypothetical protein ACRDRT_11020, partial [Pseudonocardiaceae bacterium]